MTKRALLGLGLAAMAACSSGGDIQISRPVETAEVYEMPPEKTAGWCDRCNFKVFNGHRCGLTHPCQLCAREVGARHLHQVVWQCERDELVMSAEHICNDAKNCTTCRRDKWNLIGTRGCDRCFRQVAPQKIQGITFYCAPCNLEAGANHIHGKTAYCLNCLREAGSNHRCDATRLCLDHETEHAPDHVHGTTTYCQPCHRDAGEGHKHGLTEWCWICEEEMDWPHCHH